MKFLLLFSIIVSSYSWAQIVINEVSNANGSTIILPDESTPDWIEIYNTSSLTTNLQGFGLSDDPLNPLKWKFPNYILPPNGFLTVFANGKAVSNSVDHYETAIFESDVWKYLIPSANLPAAWNTIGFSDAAWTSGSLGIGYSDGDDATNVPNPTTSVYVRKTFSVTDVNAIASAILDIDYDDGFVAYLNGVEIARAGLSGIPPNWDELASNHEAQIYAGGAISTFDLNYELVASLLQNGTNVLAIEVHNNSTTGSDLSLIPFLTFGFNQPLTYYSGSTHPYFTNPDSGGNLETNFTIKTNGESVYLSSPSGVLIDSIYVPDLEPEMSVGKLVDGTANVLLFKIATPSSSNNGSVGYVGFENTPIINLSGGFYTSDTLVSITNTAVSGGQLRYTTDGSNPTATSTLYTAPLNLAENTVLKVKCFSSTFNKLPSEMAVETFFFLEDFTLPVISISTDPVNLYGTTGIFDNYNTDWRKPCVIEYFDADGAKQFESKASVKPDGGAGGSRSNPQHSVTIEPSNSLFGAGNPIVYPLIPEKSFISNYNAFYLRNGSNYWNQYPQKDANFMRIMRETNANSQAYSPVVAFVNGEYFGVYELREKANEGYFEENYGNDPDSLDLLSVSYFYGAGVLRTVKGSDTGFYNMRNFVTSYSPAAPDYFAKSNEKIDLYNLADYLSAENWFANRDWVYNNMKIARTRTAGNKWRFFLQDMELGLGGWSDYNTNIFDYFRNENQPNAYWEIYNGLVQNTQFKNYFVNRYADLMNSVFQPSYYTPIVDTMYNQLLPELPRHFEKWTGNVAGGMDNYTNIRNDLLNQFSNRNAVVRSQIVTEFGLEESVEVYLNVLPANAGYIKISTIIPEELPWTGVYFDGVPVKITAVANPGFTFANWQANTTIPAGELDTNSIELNIANDDSFVALFTGSTQDFSLTISEIQYNPDPSVDGGNWVELHNYGNSSIDLTGWSLKSKKFWDKYSFEDGLTIPNGGFLVVCQDTNLFKLEYPSVSNFVGATGFPWSNKMDSIKLYNPYNQVAIQMEYRDELPFPVCADGWGRSLENKLFQSSALDSSVWFCGCIGGSPGKAYTPCYEPVQFTEINYNNELTSVNAGDWVELHNNSNVPIDITGYTFKDAKNDNVFTFPALTLNAGSFLVINNDLALFENRHPMVENRIGTFAFGIDSEDALRLYDASNRLITSVLFGGTNSWVNKPSYEDFTLEYAYQNGYTDPNSASSWFVGCEGGSPGRAFTQCPELPTGEILNIYPNPTQGLLQVAFDNSANTSNLTEIFVFDIQGKLVQSKTVFSEENVVGVQLELSELQHGVYFIRLQQDAKVFQKPFVKI